MLNDRTLKRWYWLHKWSSLICTVFMLMLCLTGLPLIFSHEIDRALGYAAEPSALADAGRHADLDRIIADARARRPGHTVQFLVGDPDEADVWHVRMGETADAVEPSAFYSYDARAGAFLTAYPLDQGFMNVMRRLHVDLFAGLPGMLVLGFMGLLLIASLLSGTVLYGYYMRRLPFGAVRSERSGRFKWLDLHNLLGIATLVWLTAVGVTGVINTLSIPVFNHWQATELAAMTTRYREQPTTISAKLAVDRAVEAAYRSESGRSLGFMAFPGNGLADANHFVAFMRGARPIESELLKPLLIDAYSGKVVARGKSSSYLDALLLSRPLHFGDYGGLPLKLLWALFDLITLVVLISGLYLWLKKRHLSVGDRFGLFSIAKRKITGKSSQ